MVETFKPIDLTTLGKKKERREITPERKVRGREEFEKRKNQLTLEAIHKHIQAVSYRGFRVGCCLVAEDGKGNFIRASGHNFKPQRLRQHGWDKLCAENNASTEVVLGGGEYIPGIVVASHHKEIGKDYEDATHTEKALHSCQNCRHLFRELIEEGIMSKETIIRFVNDDSLVYLDENDRETLIGGEELAPVKIQMPKLKLKRNISEEDVVNLPSEEMTMGDFLDLYKDKDKPRTKFGLKIPPYSLSLPEEKE